jgi:hypothetical protein
MGEKPAGWYYVGDGKLRYRDDYGWTEFYLDANDPQARSWPPPKPRTMLQQVLDSEVGRRNANGGKPRGLARWVRSRNTPRREGGVGL